MNANTVATMISIVYALILLGCGWAMYCNSKTHKQRKRLIDAIFRNPFGWEMRRGMFRAVTYEQHYWALFWCRDPFALYAPELVALVNHKGVAV